MIIASDISQPDLVYMTIHQLRNFFPVSEKETLLMTQIMDRVLQRVETCFDGTSNKYYHRNGQVYFNPFHSGQYCIYLYWLSRTVYEAGDSILADKIYYLNKIMNACDMFYEVELPEVFMLDHPVGSVIGRAHYNNGFSFSQTCTVGNNNNIYPVIGCNVTLCANASIIGNCHIGDNVSLGAYACVKDQDIPANSVVFGQSPNLIIKTKMQKTETDN